MKKFLTSLCLIACILGLTACGSTKQYTEYEQQKVEFATEMAAQTWVPLLAGTMNVPGENMYKEYTAEEIEFIMENNYGLKVGGNAFKGAMDSFNSAFDSIGNIVSIDVNAASAEIDGKQIIVHVPVTGELKQAEAEVILSNDMFLELESAALNPISTVGELMGRAALNTVLGMGTVFAVLILISLIIASFAAIPTIQKIFSKKKAAEPAAETKAAPVVEEVYDESDDMELVAVIAAAIAAYEGSASTDGFVVRSIHKRR